MKLKIMLAVLYSTVLALGIMTAKAQVPQYINYQGKLTDINGAPMNNDAGDPTDGNIDISFTIYDESDTAVWGPEEHADVSVQNGLFSLLLGKFSTIDTTNVFPGAMRFLEVRVRYLSPAGNISEEVLSPKKELVSVAYALNADTVDGKDSTELGVHYTGVDPIIITNATISLDYDPEDFELTGKLGVKDKWVDVTGDTMTGHLIMSGAAKVQGTGIIDSQAIKDGTITDADISPTANIAASKIDVSTIDHGSLAGLADDDHPQYHNNARGDVRYAGAGWDETTVLKTAQDHIADTNNPHHVTLEQLGGTISESDPQVGDNEANYVPRWDASVGSLTGALVKGEIYDPGTGKIGIGTDTPLDKLEVAGGNIVPAGGYGLNWRNDYVNPAGTSRTGRINTDYLYSYGRVYGSIFYDTENTKYCADPNYQSKLNQVYVDYIKDYGNLHVDGKVGIGTTSPGQKLEVNGNIRLSPSHPYLYTGGSYLHVPYGIYISGGTAYFKNQLQARGGIHDDTHSYLTIAGGTSKKTYFSGNVGIGTTSPTKKLHVNGNAEVNDTLYVNKVLARSVPIGKGPALYLHGFAGGKDRTVLVPANSGFRVTDYSNDHWTLEVDRWYGNLGVLGIVTAFRYDTRSDSRIKLEQEPLDYGLTEVLALQPKQFLRAEWTQDMETGNIEIHEENVTNDFGLIAQDVYGVIPEAVHKPEDESKELWSLSNEKIVPVLVKAIQEQQEQIELLKQQVAELKAK